MIMIEKVITKPQSLVRKPININKHFPLFSAFCLSCENCCLCMVPILDATYLHIKQGQSCP